LHTILKQQILEKKKEHHDYSLMNHRKFLHLPEMFMMSCLRKKLMMMSLIVMGIGHNFKIDDRYTNIDR